MTKLPTDREILQCIYDLYRRDPLGPLPWEDSARAPIYVPVDSTRIAKGLGADPGIMFGRLYYHLDYRHRYRQFDGSLVHLFAFKVGDQRHCINFPYLCALLAEKREEYRDVIWPRAVTGAALAVSILSLVVATLTMTRQLG